MAWQIEVSARAKGQLAKIDKTEAKRITKFLGGRLSLLDDPRSTGHGLTGDLAGLWRYRVGDFRVICDIQDQRLVVLVVQIGHRGDIYR